MAGPRRPAPAPVPRAAAPGPRPPPLVLTLSPSVADRSPAAAKRAPRPRAPAASPPAPPATDGAPLDPLAAPTHILPGGGPSLAERLAERGLRTVEDLLWMVPRRYDDVRDARSLADVVASVAEGERATLLARVASARMVFARGRRWAEVRLVG